MHECRTDSKTGPTWNYKHDFQRGVCVDCGVNESWYNAKNADQTERVSSLDAKKF